MSVDGDRALVGADWTAGQPESAGAVYVLDRGAAGWSTAARLTASDADASDWFGFSVALDGDRALVGAQGDDGVAADGGAAYTFGSGTAATTTAATGTATDTTTTTATTGPRTATAAETTTEADGVPGVGVAGALAGLLVGGLLQRLRSDER